MKTCIAAAILAMFCATDPSRAQSCYHGPVAGDVVRSIDCDTAGVTPGEAGQNRTWTITTTPVDTNPYYGYYVDPATTPFAASFPTATLAAHQSSKSGLVTYSYTRIAADSSVSLGTASTALNLPYDDALSTPLCLGYGDSTSDTYGYAYTTDAGPGASTVTHSKATVTASYDATGKLVLPWITFAAAIRTRSVTVRFDSTWTVVAGYKSPANVVQTIDTSYTWTEPSGDRDRAFSISYVYSHSAPSAGPAVDFAAKVVGYNEAVSATTGIRSAQIKAKAVPRLAVEGGRLLVRRDAGLPGRAADLFTLQGKRLSDAH